MAAAWASSGPAHGEKIPESKQTWMAFLGPDTAALGERKQAGPRSTESQIAATVAALLGKDYHAAVSQVGRADFKEYCDK